MVHRKEGILPPTDSNKDKPSILKSTREAKGLTLEIVHEATKVPMDALRAIEEGYSSRILSPFYYRGFIKIYAEFLGLDVEETYKQYGLETSPKPPVTSATVSAKAGRKTAEANEFIEQMQEGFAFIFKPKNLKLILKAIGFLLLLFLFFKTAGCVASHMEKKGAPPHKQAAILLREKKIVPPKETEHHHPTVQARSENNKVEVAVRAMKNTWIQVKSDGNVVFEMTLSKGSLESWSAKNQLELSGRNIEQLDMEVNGKHIGTLGRSNRRIRRVMITREGLKVIK